MPMQDDLDKFEAGVSAIILGAQAAQFVQENYTAIREQAERFKVDIDVYFVFVMRATLEKHQQITDEELSALIKKAKDRTRKEGGCTCDNDPDSKLTCLVHNGDDKSASEAHLRRFLSKKRHEKEG